MRQDTQKKQSAPAEERLAQLHASQKGLLARRTELERKIAELQNKRRSVNVDVAPRTEG